MHWTGLETAPVEVHLLTTSLRFLRILGVRSSPSSPGSASSTGACGAGISLQRSCVAYLLREFPAPCPDG